MKTKSKQDRILEALTIEQEIITNEYEQKKLRVQLKALQIENQRLRSQLKLIDSEGIVIKPFDIVDIVTPGKQGFKEAIVCQDILTKGNQIRIHNPF